MTAPELLAAGFCYAHIKVGNTFGSSTAVKHFVAFHSAMVEKGLAPNVALVGISRGGLCAYRFANENSQKKSLSTATRQSVISKVGPPAKEKVKAVQRIVPNFSPHITSPTMPKR